MTGLLPAELQALDDQLNATAQDARTLVDGLDEVAGTWRPAAGAWSVAECLDHLATANRVYLQSLDEAARLAREHGRIRKGPALPGVIGRWFVQYMEPPARPLLRSKAPRLINPRPSPALATAFADFMASHEAVRAFLSHYSDIDLGRVRFKNPLVRGVRFSIATGLHVIPAHERRHLWQAWNVRRAAENAGV